MSLRAAAKHHRVGAITFYMLPIKGIGFQMAVRWANEKWGTDAEQWPEECVAFLAAVPATVDLELDHDASDEEHMLRTFWDNRTHDLDQDWTLFLQCMTTDTSLAWYEAYEQTRKTTLQADESLQRAPDETWTDDQKKDGAPSSNGSETPPESGRETTSRKKVSEN